MQKKQNKSKTVAALGLHETDNPTAETSYATLIQNFNRFILEHLQLEMTKHLPQHPLILRPLPPAIRHATLARLEHLVKRQLIASAQITELASSETDREKEGPSKSPVSPGHRHPFQPQHQHQHQQQQQHQPFQSQQLQATIASLTAGQSAIQQLLGMTVATSDTCSQCKTQSIREAPSFVIDLLSPKKVKEVRASQGAGVQQGVTFGQVLETSVNREMQPKAWCASCNKYQFATQKKYAQTLPNVLSLNCGTVTEEDMAHWKGFLLLFFPS